MKILHIVRRFVKEKWGGTETVVLALAKAAQRRGHDVEIVCPSIFSTTGLELVADVPVRRFSYFYPYFGLNPEAVQSFNNRGGNLFSFSLFYYLLRCLKPDLIHLHSGKRLGGIVRTAARFRKIPYFISVHGGLFDVPKEEKESYIKPAVGSWEWGRALGLIFGSHRVFQDAAGIFCLSRKEQEFLQAQYPRNKVYLLPNGVDTERFRFSLKRRDEFRLLQGLPLDSTVILNVARLDPQKNQLILLPLIKRLRQEGSNVFLFLAGAVTDENYQRLFWQEVQRQQLTPFVRSVGSLEPDNELLVDLYQGADLFLLPSRHEPFGIVILEAWAASLPVLASRVGGVPDLIQDGIDGWLFSVTDEEELFQKTRQLLMEQKTRDALKTQALSRVQNSYDWCYISSYLEELYTQAFRK